MVEKWVCPNCGDPMRAGHGECGPCHSFFRGRKLGSKVLLGIAQQIADGETGQSDGNE